MFDTLTEQLGKVFDRLRKRGALSEADVGEALREVRVALLEADVALPVVKSFIDTVRAKAVGAEVLRSVTPAQMVIKVVHDQLIAMLGGTSVEFEIAAAPPAPLLLVGLQGSGKTTTAAKIAIRLRDRAKQRALLASLDTRRPAAQEQLRVLGEQAGVATLPIVAGQMPVEIARRAMAAARLQGFDVVILDTAGRLHVDEALMAEAAAVRDAVNPVETLLVADALTGQDAVNLAQRFSAHIGLTGVVLTRIDGDARGGAALSIRAVAGCPIKLIGTGEKLDALEGFHPDRIASRILGMGDVVSLVERAQETIAAEDAERLEAKLLKGQFDLADLGEQLRQMRRMGGMQGLMALLPGVGKVKRQLGAAGIDDRMLARQVAMIQSMTPMERRNARLIGGSRKRRIAAGSGTSVQEVNRLLKQYKQMSEMVRKVGKLGKQGLLRAGLGQMPSFPGYPGRPR
ncbi:MAG: signal recognition particle protein [Alphaproteobacteria bacterium]|nr:signal recognition particle protein [Alphaproteobacteria bacterium]